MYGHAVISAGKAVTLYLKMGGLYVTVRFSLQLIVFFVQYFILDLKSQEQDLWVKIIQLFHYWLCSQTKLF